MKILVSCEFSGIVREAFRKKGHDAWSCDILPTEIPGKHIQGDVLDILSDEWDIMTYAALPPYTQIVQPNQHGHETTKKTCLWLKNLPPLRETKKVGEGEKYVTPDGKSHGPKWYYLTPHKDRWKARSRTFQGIADAMAEQWG